MYWRIEGLLHAVKFKDLLLHLEVLDYVIFYGIWWRYGPSRKHCLQCCRQISSRVGYWCQGFGSGVLLRWPLWAEPTGCPVLDTAAFSCLQGTAEPISCGCGIGARQADARQAEERETAVWPPRSGRGGAPGARAEIALQPTEDAMSDQTSELQPLKTLCWSRNVFCSTTTCGQTHTGAEGKHEMEIEAESNHYGLTVAPIPACAARGG